MKASNIRGAILEFLVRRLLTNCGFIPVMPDGLYTYDNGGLFYVNGRGAAHDADVLMEPPIQMPFAYPTRVLFECKAYSSKASLPIVRNALGLRQDINEFEVVTKKSLMERKNNRRAQYAIEQRNRYHYQVGVASANDFTKPAIEFAVNNKIPLLSMTWFLIPSAVDLFDDIDQTYVDSINETLLSQVYTYLKDRSRDADSEHQQARAFVEGDIIIGKIMSSFMEIRESLFVGLLETGDIIFLVAQDSQAVNRFLESSNFAGLRAQLHYSRRLPELWYLSITLDAPNQADLQFNFYVPPRIMSIWGEYDTSRSSAIDIKAGYFSRIIIFNRAIRPDLPFFIVNLDSSWLEDIRQAETDSFASDRG